MFQLNKKIKCFDDRTAGINQVPRSMCTANTRCSAQNPRSTPTHINKIVQRMQQCVAERRGKRKKENIRVRRRGRSQTKTEWLMTEIETPTASSKRNNHKVEARSWTKENKTDEFVSMLSVVNFASYRSVRSQQFLHGTKKLSVFNCTEFAALGRSILSHRFFSFSNYRWLIVAVHLLCSDLFRGAQKCECLWIIKWVCNVCVVFAISYTHMVCIIKQ